MSVFWLILLIIFVYTLHRRVSGLESKVDQLKQQLGVVPASADKLSAAEKPAPAAEMKTSTRTTAPKSPGQFDQIPTQFWQWLSVDWPLKTGAFLIILGFGWLVTYAFLNNWIGPTGRITLGLLAGTGIVLGGHYRLRGYRHQGLTLELLGSVVMQISVFAAQNVYEMFSVPVAFIFGVAPVFFLAYSSLVYRDRWLALSGLVMGGMVPLLTGGGGGSVVGLYSYLFALSAGTLWLARYTDWQFLTPSALVIVALFSLSRFFFPYDFVREVVTPSQLIQLRFFAVSFSTLFFAGNVASILGAQSVRRAHLVTGLLVGLFILGWINGLVPGHLQGVMAILVAVGLAMAASVIFRRSRNPYPVYVYSGTALLLLTAAAAYQFDGPVLIIALSVIAAAVPLISLPLLGGNVSLTLLWYFLLPAWLSLGSFFSYAWTNGTWQNDFYALAAAGGALWVVGLYLYQNKQRWIDTNEQHLRSTTNLLLIGASIYTLAIIWLVSHAEITSDYLATTLSLAIYIVVGLVAYFRGQQLQRNVLQRYGQVLTLLVIARLLLVEIWGMALVGRIVTFFLIGTLLMVSVLVQKKKTDDE